MVLTSGTMSPMGFFEVFNRILVVLNRNLPEIAGFQTAIDEKCGDFAGKELYQSFDYLERI